MVEYCAFSHKIDYVKNFKGILNLKGHSNCISGSKVTAVLLNGWILTTGELHREGSAPAAGLFRRETGIRQGAWSRSGIVRECLRQPRSGSIGLGPPGQEMLPPDRPYSPC